VGLDASKFDAAKEAASPINSSCSVTGLLRVHKLKWVNSIGSALLALTSVSPMLLPKQSNNQGLNDFLKICWQFFIPLTTQEMAQTDNIKSACRTFIFLDKVTMSLSSIPSPEIYIVVALPLSLNYFPYQSDETVVSIISLLCKAGKTIHYTSISHRGLKYRD
jgi:hypothetical protein